MRSRTSVAGTIWGLLFCFIAALGVMWSSGVTIRLTALGIIVPLFLIGLGGLGIVLSRRN